MVVELGVVVVDDPVDVLDDVELEDELLTDEVEVEVEVVVSSHESQGVPQQPSGSVHRSRSPEHPSSYINVPGGTHAA